ncbi:MAG: alpha-amylase family glycosyl hydrolase [Lysobacter sp.]
MTLAATLLAIIAACSPTPPEQAAAAVEAPVGDAPTHVLAKAGEEVFYHVFMRSFADANGDRIGDLAGLTDRLDYLRELGITSILLTPLQPSPFYHSYFATDFKAIDPAYGTMDDYYAFVRAAHAHGLKVYLDQEIQYVAEGHPWLEQSRGKPDAPFAEFLLWRDAEHTEPEPFLHQARWEHYDGRHIEIAMVDMNRPAVKRYFEELLLFFADPHGDGSGRDGVDGFRIDHMMDDLDHKGLATNLFADFWTPIFDALRERRPGFRILAEQSDWGFGEDWLVEGDADLVFAFPLRGALIDLDKSDIVDAARKTAAITPDGKGQIVFLENHDTDRFMSLLQRDGNADDAPARARAGAALALLMQGEPLLYYGQELGMRGITRTGTLSDSAHIPLREAMRWSADLDAAGSATWYQGDQPWWTDRYNRSNDGVSVEEQDADAGSLLNLYRSLLALRAARPELRDGDQQFACPDSPDIVCLLRTSGTQHTLLLANLGTTPAAPGLDAALSGETWTDLLDGGTVDPSQSLPAMAIRILGSP